MANEKIIIGAAILILFIALLAWAAFILIAKPANAGQSQIQGANVSQNGSTGQPGPGNGSISKLDQDWSKISKDNVENACFSQAKDQAVKKGYNAALVFGCSCTADESTETKTYSCKVSALDGEHAVGIICTKSKQACSISSKDVNGTYTFSQLQSLES
jgi:hypothetical protein